MKAMHKDLLKHTAVLVRLQYSIEMRDRIDVLNSDKLSRHDQDDLSQLVFAEGDALVERESVYHFLHWVLEFQ
jgi:hypothetical protein